MDKQRGPVTPYMPHSSSAVLLIWGCGGAGGPSVSPSGGEAAPPIRLICRLMPWLIFFLSLSFCFTGREPDFSQRSVQFLKNVSFSVQPGHLQVRPAADASQRAEAPSLPKNPFNDVSYQQDVSPVSTFSKNSFCIFFLVHFS